ncbi:MAG: hypothetical protein EOP22_13860 [Hyphomicrobiales bacterium]|nr:MAG: hypothetical protein EOP22_13860 [Hyphomicrobiales bacterium]
MRRVVLQAFCAVFISSIAIGPGAAQQLPAVSGLNGKIEFNAGLLNVPAPTFVGRAAGAVTVPVGDSFGLQADFTAASAPGLTLGGALHIFTRDPSSHLIGGTFGVMRTPGAIIFAAGPEAEFYFDNVSIEAWGGLSYAKPTVGADRLLPFVMADVAYYPEPNWRLSLGLSSLDGYNAVHAGTEYLIDGFDLPVSLTADARLGQDGAILATIGLRAYIGGQNKSLLRRHREDDPADRGASLYNAAGGLTIRPKQSAGSDPEPGGGPVTCKNTMEYVYIAELGYCVSILDSTTPEP